MWLTIELLICYLTENFIGDWRNYVLKCILKLCCMNIIHLPLLSGTKKWVLFRVHDHLLFTCYSPVIVFVTDIGRWICSNRNDWRTMDRGGLLWSAIKVRTSGVFSSRVCSWWSPLQKRADSVSISRELRVWRFSVGSCQVSG